MNFVEMDEASKEHYAIAKLCSQCTEEDRDPDKRLGTVS